MTFLSDHRNELERCKAPALILQCSDDLIAPVAVGQYMHRALPRSMLRVIDNVGHCPHLRAPHASTVAMEEFLESGLLAMSAVLSVPNADTLLEYAACGLIVTDARGTILRVNHTFCTWLGYAAGDLVGQRRLQDLFSIGGKVFHQTHLEPLMQMQGSVAEVQLDMRHRDGHTLPMLFNSLRRVREGQIVDETAVLIATDRRKYERELVLARQHAEAALAARREAVGALQESRDVLGIAMRGAKMGVWSRSSKP